MAVLRVSPLLLCVMCVLSAHAAALEYVDFDASTASSVYASEKFAPSSAMAAGSSYWCSAAVGGLHSWTGILSSRVQAAGVKMSFAYAPSEYKVLVSADGANFEEATPWTPVTRGDASFTQLVMFELPRPIWAATVLMRGGAAPYVGLSHAALLALPAPGMLVSGAPMVAEEEQCLMVEDRKLSLQGCLEAMGTSDAREIFELTDEGLLKTSKGCIVYDTAAARLEEALCPASPDSASTFKLTPEGLLQLVRMGDLCVGSKGKEATPCPGATPFFQVASQHLDPNAAAFAHG